MFFSKQLVVVVIIQLENLRQTRFCESEAEAEGTSFSNGLAWVEMGLACVEMASSIIHNIAHILMLPAMMREVDIICMELK